MKWKDQMENGSFGKLFLPKTIEIEVVHIYLLHCAYSLYVYSTISML